MKNRGEFDQEIETNFITPEIINDDKYTKCPIIFEENFTNNNIKKKRKRERERKNDPDSIIKIIIRHFLNYLISILNLFLSGHEIKRINDKEKQKYFTKGKIKNLFEFTIKDFLILYYPNINPQLSEELLKKEIKEIYLNSYLELEGNIKKLVFPNNFPTFRKKIEKIRERTPKEEYIEKIQIIAKNLPNYCNENYSKKNDNIL